MNNVIGIGGNAIDRPVLADFNILPDGSAYVSQRRLALALDIPETTLRDFFRAENIDTSQGVKAELVAKPAQHI